MESSSREKKKKKKKKNTKVDKSGREGKEDWRIEGEGKKKIKNGNVQTINQMDKIYNACFILSRFININILFPSLLSLTPPPRPSSRSFSSFHARLISLSLSLSLSDRHTCPYTVQFRDVPFNRMRCLSLLFILVLSSAANQPQSCHPSRYLAIKFFYFACKKRKRKKKERKKEGKKERKKEKVKREERKIKKKKQKKKIWIGTVSERKFKAIAESKSTKNRNAPSPRYSPVCAPIISSLPHSLIL